MKPEIKVSQPRPGRYGDEGPKPKTSSVGQILSRPEHVAAGEEKQVAVRRMETRRPQAEGHSGGRIKAASSGHYEADQSTKRAVRLLHGGPRRRHAKVRARCHAGAPTTRQASMAHVSGAAAPSPPSSGPGLLEAEPRCEPADRRKNCPTVPMRPVGNRVRPCLRPRSQGRARRTAAGPEPR